jgi:adenylate cyclase
MMSRLSKGIFLGAIIGIVGLVVSLFQFALNLEENAGLGLLFQLRGVRPAPSDVVVVSIDKESSEYLNLPDNPDKWPRSGVPSFSASKKAEI